MPSLESNGEAPAGTLSESSTVDMSPAGVLLVVQVESLPWAGPWPCGELRFHWQVWRSCGGC